MTSPVGAGSQDPRLDPVVVSVAAYREHADEYAAAHATKMLDTVERFAGAVEGAGFAADRAENDGFVEVWATRLG